MALAVAQETEELRLLLDGVEDLYDSGNVATTSTHDAVVAINAQCRLLRALRDVRACVHLCVRPRERIDRWENDTGIARVG